MRELHQLRLEVLRSWTTARRMEQMTKEEVESLQRRERRLHNAVVYGIVDEKPPSGWVPFQALLEEFEEAVREDERGR